MWLNVPGYIPRRVRAKADFIPLKITTGQATEIKVLLEPCTGSPCGNPAQFSFDTKLLTIPTVKVPNVGGFAVQLQGDDSFTFTVLMDKLTPLSEATDYVAHLSSETWQLFIPRVKIVMPSGEEKLLNSSPLLMLPKEVILDLKIIDYKKSIIAAKKRDIRSKYSHF